MFQILQNNNITDLQIWSDGGPKHFKLSPHLYYWWKEIKAGLPFDVTYNFFEVCFSIKLLLTLLYRHTMAIVFVMPLQHKQRK